MDAAVSIHNLGKKYKLHTHKRYVALRDVISNSLKNLFRSAPESDSTFWALKNIDLDIQQGDRVGIIGHNGAGKSTLLKIISRITPPTKGTVTINGRVASLLEVGTGFHPELTGKENIYLNGSILGLKKKEIDEKIDRIIEFSEVEQFIDAPLKHYSSGMQLRLAFSVAAHLEPEILLIDEVLAVGDITFQKKCLGKMDEVSKTKGRTILFVSHNIGFIQSLCTKTILLSKGELINYGETNIVLENYLKLTSKQQQPSVVYGNKKAIVLNCELLFNNAFTQNFFLGYPASIRLKLRTDDDLRNMEIAFNIKNIYGELVTHITTLDQLILIQGKKSEEITIEANLDYVSLTPGNYKIDVFILNNGEMCYASVDHTSFEVLNSDKALRPHGFPSHVKYFTGTSWRITKQ